jgi:LPXTG-motif cell wall-anchored protein
MAVGKFFGSSNLLISNLKHRLSLRNTCLFSWWNKLFF